MTIKEFLLHPPFRENVGFFMACRGVCCYLGHLGGEEQVFRGREKGYSEVWSLVRFHISLWASISKTFCNYITLVTFYSVGLTFSRGVFVVLIFLYALEYFYFFSMKAIISIRKKKQDMRKREVLPSQISSYKFLWRPNNSNRSKQ